MIDPPLLFIPPLETWTVVPGYSKGSLVVKLITPELAPIPYTAEDEPLTTSILAISSPESVEAEASKKLRPYVFNSLPSESNMVWVEKTSTPSLRETLNWLTPCLTTFTPTVLSSKLKTL